MEEVAIIADPQGKSYDFAKGIYTFLKSRENKDFSVCPLVDVEIINFRDGEFKVKISKNIRRKKCFFIFDSNKEPSRWLAELTFTLQAIASSSSEEINIIFPYFRFARQDRKDESRVSVNAKAVAEIISMYATRGLTVDLHAPQIQEYFKIPFDNLYSFPILINYLEANHKQIFENLVVVSPDLGGGKRADALVKGLIKRGIKAEVALGYKRREKDNEVSKIMIIGDVKDKNCLIVDDIIDTGNTIVRTAEVLKENGAKKVFVYGTHGLFTEGIEKFNVFDKVIVSDSLNNEAKKNLEIVSLTDLFGEAIYRTIIGKSLSELFG